MDDRVEKKLDKIAEDITEIKVTLAGQHVSLVEHVRRTNLLEKKIEPIQKHVDYIQGGIKLILLLGGVAAIIEAVSICLK